jgi:carbon storage regulator
MLVLARKVGERIIIANDIVITVLAVEKDRVKIGIDAPAQVPILRHEVYESIKQANREAATLAAQASDDVLSSVSELLRGQDA